MPQKRKGMINSSTSQSIIGLYLATLLGTALGIVSSIINTRFLSPIDYGDVRYVQNVLNIICSVLFVGHFYAGSRYLAISKSEAESRKLRGAMTILLSAISLLCVVVTVLCAVAHSSEQVRHLLFMSCTICMEPLLLSYVNNVFQGDNHIWRIAVARFLPTALYIAIAWPIFAHFGANSESMLLMQWGVATLVFIVLIVSTRLDFQHIHGNFVRLKQGETEFGRKIYAGTLITVGVNYLAGVTLGLFNVDNTVSGYYTLALTVTYPLTLLPSIISTSLFKKMASQERIPIKVFALTVGVTVLTCVFFVLLIKPIVILFYTERYRNVGVYAQYLAAASCLHGLGDFIKGYLTARGIGHGIEMSCLASGIVKIIGFLVLVCLFNITGAIITLFVGETVYFCGLLFYYKRREVTS